MATNSNGPTNVLAEILRWSRDLRTWQRDALRRLLSGPLDASDIDELSATCKAAHGLVTEDVPPPDPVHARHLPSDGEAVGLVNLSSLTHVSGVNALAPNQVVDFGPHLTVVYGANAAGKSGYTRILKRACRARGAEEVLGNVLGSQAPGRPHAVISYTLDGTEDSCDWIDQDEPDESLSHVRVFDSFCASVYLREETDVTFRPFGLDLFDGLADACEQVKRSLTREKATLEAKAPTLPTLTAGTRAQTAVAGITGLTNVDDLRSLATLSETETRRRKALAERLRDLANSDPAKLGKALKTRASTLDRLASQIEEVERALGDTAVTRLSRARSALAAAKANAEKVQRKAFGADLLPGSGSDEWVALWDAARVFSVEAYPEHDYPVTHDSARCVLCQESLNSGAKERLRHFEEFSRSEAQTAVDQKTASLEQIRQELARLRTDSQDFEAPLAQLAIDDEVLAERATAFTTSAAKRHAALQRAASGNRSAAPVPALEATRVSEIRGLVGNLRARGAALEKDANPSDRAALQRQYDELEARRQLATHLPALLAEIERRKRLLAYTECIQETNTTGITKKSSELTKKVVTERLKAAFAEELQRLDFRPVEIELEAARGSVGVLYHKLQFRRAKAMELPSVLSEGESRALSLAAFLAELATGDHKSTIIFDDPVSSLDHDWRERVAARLVAEARHRQVVVFTHDVVFLVALADRAREESIPCKHQYLQRESMGAGVSSSDLPWIAMRVRERLGVLRNLWQEADAASRKGPRRDYEAKALYVYGKLRETWERAVEEVLLAGVVERYRRNIQTQQIGDLADINAEDCKELDAGMTKSSRWLPGHDKALAENPSVPEPEELKADIDALDTWLSRIKKRRGKK